MESVKKVMEEKVASLASGSGPPSPHARSSKADELAGMMTGEEEIELPTTVIETEHRRMRSFHLESPLRDVLREVREQSGYEIDRRQRSGFGYRRTRSFDLPPKAKHKQVQTPGISKEKEGLKVALSFLTAQDVNVLNSAAHSVSLLLATNTGLSATTATQNHGGAGRGSVAPRRVSTYADSKTTADEVTALCILAQSENPIIRKTAASLLKDMAARNSFPRGTSTLKHIMAKCTKMMHENMHSNRFPLISFALRMALTLASQGPIWRDRLVERNWVGYVIEIVLKIVSNHSVDPQLEYINSPSSRRRSQRSNSPLNSYITQRRQSRVSNSNPQSQLHSEAVGDETMTGLFDRRESYTEFDVHRFDLASETQSSVSSTEPNLHIYGEPKEVLKLALQLISTLDSSTDVNITTQLLGLLSFVLSELSSKINGDVPLLLLVCSAVDSLIVNIDTNDRIAEMVRENVIEKLLLKGRELCFQVHQLTHTLRTSVTAPDVTAPTHNSLRDPDLLLHDSFDGESMASGFITFQRSPPSRRPYSPKWVADMLKKNFQLTKLLCKITAVLTKCCASHRVADTIAKLFDKFCVMKIVTVLYRSNFSGTRTSVAEFLKALCAGLDEQKKLLICESGVIVRLLSLASPSAVYSGVDETRFRDSDVAETLERIDEGAFIPAIEALTELAKVKVIAARIVLAGGLGPLYSHANSSRRARIAARKALNVLSIQDINELINWYVEKRSSTADSDLSSIEGSPNSPMTTDSITEDGIKRVDFNDLLAAQAEQSLFDKRFIIGSGAFSTVFRAQMKLDTSSGERIVPVALKRLTVGAMKDMNYIREAKILSQIPEHPNICTFHGMLSTQVDNGTTVLLVSELGGESTLSWYLKHGTTSFSWTERLRMLSQVSEALRFLHSLKPAVLHLDIKSNNIIVQKRMIAISSTPANAGDGDDYHAGEYIVKLCDFGLAITTELKSGLDFLNPQNCGTLQWMAPEVMRDEGIELSRGFDERAEVFSFAVLMWEFAHPGRVPWDELTITNRVRFEGNPSPQFSLEEESIQERIRRLVCSGRRLTCQGTARWPRGFETLMRRCWRQVPSERPSFIRSFLPESNDSETISEMLVHIMKRLEAESVNICRRRSLQHRPVSRSILRPSSWGPTDFRVGQK